MKNIGRYICLIIIFASFIFGPGLFAIAEENGVAQSLPDIPSDINEVIKALKSKDAKLRQVGIYKLHFMGKDAARAIPYLINLLQDNTATSGGDVITSIGFQAAGALAAIGEPAVLPLIDKLKDTNTDVRQRAIYALGYIKDLRAVEPIIASLKDTSEEVRHYAAAALGQIGDSKAVEPLISALNDSFIYTRLSAADSLGRIKDSRATKPLVMRIKDESSEVRNKAVWALGQIKDTQATPDLINCLKSADLYLKNEAIKSLGEIGDKRAISHLLDLLNDKEKFVRLFSAESLGKIGDASAIKSLARLLEDNEVDVRRTASQAMRKIKDESSFDYFIRALGDTDESVRSEAASALGELGDKRAVEPLIAALNDENEWVVRAAAESLGNLGDARAIGPLKALANNKQVGVSMAADAALNRLMDKDEYSKYLNDKFFDREAREIKDYEDWMSKANDEEKKKVGAEAKLKEMKFHHGRTIFYRGRDLYDKKNYSEAMKIFESALEMDPGCFEATLYKGKVYRKLKENGKAITSFKDAIRVAEEEFGKNKEVKYDYFETVHVRATEQMILVYIDIEDYKMALELTREAIERYQKWLAKNRSDDFLTAYIQRFNKLLRDIEAKKIQR